jgi:hypothetical protein
MERMALRQRKQGRLGDSENWKTGKLEIGSAVRQNKSRRLFLVIGGCAGRALFRAHLLCPAPSSRRVREIDRAAHLRFSLSLSLSLSLPPLDGTMGLAQRLAEEPRSLCPTRLMIEPIVREGGPIKRARLLSGKWARGGSSRPLIRQCEEKAGKEPRSAARA